MPSDSAEHSFGHMIDLAIEEFPSGKCPLGFDIVLMSKNVPSGDLDGQVLDGAFDAQDEVVGFLISGGSVPFKNDFVGGLSIKSKLNAALGDVVNFAHNFNKG